MPTFGGSAGYGYPVSGAVQLPFQVPFAVPFDFPLLGCNPTSLQSRACELQVLRMLEALLPFVHGG